jgi:hypothetical protein
LARQGPIPADKSVIHRLNDKNDAIDTGHSNPVAGWQIRALHAPCRVVNFDFTDSIDNRVIQRKNPPGVLLAALIQQWLV